MTVWAQLLHFYQPPTQTHDILRKVVNESYRPLMRVLSGFPNARVAVNINAVLTEMLVEHGYTDVIDSLHQLSMSGQVEFVGSGRFHPILPLIRPSECDHSIHENGDINRHHFKNAWNPVGFFPPEMCWGQEIAAPIARYGHRWVILSGVACPEPWPTDLVYRTRAGRASLNVLFRDDVRSNRISFRQTSAESFLEDVASVGADNDQPTYVVTAMDAETYGHHLPGWEEEFLATTFELMSHPKGPFGHVRPVLPSEVASAFPTGPSITPRPSSWSTSEQDIAQNNPYPLWKAPGNQVHALQWDYVEHCVDLLAIARHHAHNKEARKYAALSEERLQPALHSCQFWWASRRPMWNVTMIHHGLVLLSEALLYAAKSIGCGSAPPLVKREVDWRMAAANDIRWAIDRELLKPDPA